MGRACSNCNHAPFRFLSRAGGLSSHSAHQRPGIFQSQTSHIHEDRLNETVMAPVYSNHRQPFAHSIFAHRGAFKGQ